MRIFLNCKEAITEIGRELRKCSAEVHTQSYQNKVIAEDADFNTRELEGFSFAIIDTSDYFMMPEYSDEWVPAEFRERIADLKDVKNPGEAWKLREKVWSEFINEEGKFDYTYGERICTQLQVNINELRKNPETRQAIIQIHNRQIDQEFLGGERRVPCTMFYQFMKRDGKLDVIYVMRSTDFATHFQNDIALAILLRDHIAKEIGIERGKFIMFASSLHIYQKDWELLNRY